MAKELTPHGFLEACEQLDALCRDEYERDRPYGLLELLGDSNRELSQARLQRLTGIVLKKKFADAQCIDAPYKLEGHAGPKLKGATGAKQRWIWKKDRLREKKRQESEEFWILDQIRQELPTVVGDWLEPTWDDFVREVDTESGLYKVLTRYLVDKWNRRETKSFKEYYSYEGSRNFETLIKLGDYVGQMALIGALFPILPCAPVVVPIAIIAAEYGYRAITDPPKSKDLLNN